MLLISEIWVNNNVESILNSRFLHFRFLGKYQLVLHQTITHHVIYLLYSI